MTGPFPWQLPIRRERDPGRPALLVVIDTEEEFDWGGGFSREATGVTAMDHLHRVQAVCEARGVKPIYVVDHAVASQERGYAYLRDLARAERAVIGAHLHPWVNPPFGEELNRANSFPGNLPPALERAKLQELTRVIQENIGVRPTVYKAGRYGLGRHTPAILAELGYQLDLSPAPPFDYRPEGGPDYSDLTAHAFHYPTDPPVLAIPTTGGYVGGLPWHGLYRFAQSPLPRSLHLPGVLARLGLLERIRLSPEGHTLEEMQRLTRVLLRRGVRRFQLSLHSPSLGCGFTPYARDARERDALVARVAGYLGFFERDVMGGVG